MACTCQANGPVGCEQLVAGLPSLPGIQSVYDRQVCAPGTGGVHSPSECYCNCYAHEQFLGGIDGPSIVVGTAWCPVHVDSPSPSASTDLELVLGVVGVGAVIGFAWYSQHHQVGPARRRARAGHR